MLHKNKTIKRNIIFLIHNNIIQKFISEKLPTDKNENDLFLINYENNKNHFYKKVCCRDTNNYFNIEKLLYLNEKTKTLNKLELQNLKHQKNFSYILSNNNQKITKDNIKITIINLKLLVGKTLKNIHFQKLKTLNNVTLVLKYI